MPISMSTSAHYTTQASAYDRLLVGRRLTDRIITRRKKQGYFGDGLINQERTEKRKSRSKKQAFKDLMKDFV